MALGPVEVIVVGFPGNRFTGTIVPELERLVAAGTIRVIDGLFLRKDADGSVTFVELDQIGPDDDAAVLAALLDQVESLISDEDVMHLAEDLEPNSSAAMLVFEHTWAKPFRDAIVESGGVLVADFRMSGLAIETLLEELATLSAES